MFPSNALLTENKRAHLMMPRHYEHIQEQLKISPIICMNNIQNKKISQMVWFKANFFNEMNEYI